MLSCPSGEVKPAPAPAGGAAAAGEGPGPLRMRTAGVEADGPCQALPAMVRAYSPGRVNLMGDHTDYNEGLALPMAIDRGTTVRFEADDSRRVVLRSSGEPDLADVDVHFPLDPDQLSALQPRWARLVAAMVAVTRPSGGGVGRVETTLPVGAGLSSSAALEVALALAFGFEATPVVMARTCQRAEQAATGAPTGIMDQLAVAGGVEGCALLIDFSDLAVTPVPVPDRAEVVAVHSGTPRVLAHTAYAARRAECEAAAYRLGPLGRLGPEDVTGIADPVLRRRVRHVVSECDRVRWCAEALVRGDLVDAGNLMISSHHSLARDFEVSTPALDGLMERLTAMPGVYGARLTGAGFGGCVVALAEPGAIDVTAFATPAWRLRPSGGAAVVG
jgi:galactokinase